MHAIEQLKSMRESAHERLETNADYRLMVSLDALIGDLEEISRIGIEESETITTQPAASIHSIKEHYEMPTGDRDEVFEQLASEITGEDVDEDADDLPDTAAYSAS